MPGSTSTGYRASRRNADKLQSVDVEYSSESSLSFDSMPSTPQMDFTLSDNDEYKPHSSQRRATTSRGKGNTKKIGVSKGDERPRRGRGKGKGANPRKGGRGSKVVGSNGSTDAFKNDSKIQLIGSNEYIRTPIVTRIDDEYVSVIPLCLVCGGAGRDCEGSMVICMTCAQSFHTYCVGLKKNSLLSKRGWRCLDCTACEECGKNSDEPNMLLCSGCDITYHTYCLIPPLQKIPTEPWLCKWCATCYRCNKMAIKNNTEFRLFEGLCETCYSFQKCSKCRTKYKIGELMLKCQRCHKWSHASCEDCQNEDQAEKASENYFRCKSCRPKIFSDSHQLPVITENIMVSKHIADNIGTLDRLFTSDTHRSRPQFYGSAIDVASMSTLSYGPTLGLRGTGRGCGRAGRGIFRIGVGGFVAKVPRHRLSNVGSLPPNEDDSSCTPPTEMALPNPSLYTDERPKLKRMRKSRRPKLEETYTNVIQESFFGGTAVDSKILSEQNVTEPSLIFEHRRANVDENSGVRKPGCELSEQLSEMLRNDQVSDMIGDMLGDTNIDLLFDFDFADLIDDCDEDSVSHANTSYEDGAEHSVKSTTPGLSNIPSSSMSGNRDKADESKHDHARMFHSSDQIPSRLKAERLSTSSQATERWEEDEPLGDKATKAAVLYANVHHSELKVKFPLWQTRAKAINRLWRELDADKRQEFVDWARRNRANCPVPRRRCRRILLSDEDRQFAINMSEIRTSEETTNKDISGINATFVPLQTNLNTTVDSAQQNQHDIPMPVALKLAHPSPQAPVDTGSKSIQMITPNIQNRQISQYYPCSSLAKETVIAASPFSQRLSELETEKLHYETEVEKLRKIKRLQAAKLRQLSKEKCGLPESTQQSNEEDMAKQLNEVSEAQKTFDSTKKAVLYTQRQLEKCKARIREHTSVVESVNLNQKQEFSSLAYLSSSGPTPYHPQPSVIQNQPPDQFIQEPLLQSNSASIKSMNQSLPNTPFHPSVKSTRGRKRKNFGHRPRTSYLGSIKFTSLQTEIEKDVYDVLDDLLNTLDPPKFKNTESILQNPSEQPDKPKQKRRRIQAPKAQHHPPDNTNEWEVIQQRICQKVAGLSLPHYSLEQYDVHNKRILHYFDQTLLPLQPPVIFSKTSKVGSYELTFMHDYFTRLESADESKEEQYDVRLTLDIDSSEESLQNFMTTLCDLLHLPSPLEYKLETPPPSPTPNENISIKMEMDESPTVSLSLVRSEPIVAVFTDTDRSVDEEEQILTDLYQPRENVLNVNELSLILSSTTKELSKGEYKWKGHGWMLYDESIQKLFDQQKELINQLPISNQIHTKIVDNELKNCVDLRSCAFCNEKGDGEPNITGRLLNVDANEWAHVNCAFWSAEVHETKNGALMNVESAIKHAKLTKCNFCDQTGASIRCFRLECASTDTAFHLPCAIKSAGKFASDKNYYCGSHDIRADLCIDKLESLRRIYINRDENQLLAKIFNHSLPVEMMLRIGNLLFYRLGQLLPEQLKTFHNVDHIFPIGYKVVRMFWSTKNIVGIEHYACEITDNNNIPEFSVKFGDTTHKGVSACEAWKSSLEAISRLRDGNSQSALKFHMNNLSGVDLFGFNEQSITKMTESLPGVDQLYTYLFKHGGSPLMDLPLAVNPSGCVRCEPCLRTLIKRHKANLIISSSPKKERELNEKRSFYAEIIVPRGSRTRSISNARFVSNGNKMDDEMLRAYRASGISEKMLQAAYLRCEPVQTIAQYREMQRNWKNTVYLARSKIQGMGLYAKRDLDMNSMIVEYLGEMIRSEVGEIREKKYMAQNRGVYMFRVDDEWFVDATMSGGCARYINHSCDPNCSTKILTISDEKKIIVVANRPIKSSEELTYDYQFEFEDTSEKIPCLCGAPNCMKWMN